MCGHKIFCTDLKTGCHHWLELCLNYQLQKCICIFHLNNLIRSYGVANFKWQFKCMNMVTFALNYVLKFDTNKCVCQPNLKCFPWVLFLSGRAAIYSVMCSNSSRVMSIMICARRHASAGKKSQRAGRCLLAIAHRRNFCVAHRTSNLSFRWCFSFHFRAYSGMHKEVQLL